MPLEMQQVNVKFLCLIISQDKRWVFHVLGHSLSVQLVTVGILKPFLIENFSFQHMEETLETENAKITQYRK